MKAKEICESIISSPPGYYPPEGSMRLAKAMLVAIEGLECIEDNDPYTGAKRMLQEIEKIMEGE